MVLGIPKLENEQIHFSEDLELRSGRYSQKTAYYKLHPLKIGVSRFSAIPIQNPSRSFCDSRTHSRMWRATSVLPRVSLIKQSEDQNCRAQSAQTRDLRDDEVLMLEAVPDSDEGGSTAITKSWSVLYTTPTKKPIDLNLALKAMQIALPGSAMEKIFMILSTHTQKKNGLTNWTILD